MINKLYEKHIGTDLRILNSKCEFLEIDKLRSEKGELLGYVCLLKYPESDTMSTSCQPSLELAIKAAALKAAGIDLGESLK